MEREANGNAKNGETVLQTEKRACVKILQQKRAWGDGEDGRRALCLSRVK